MPAIALPVLDSLSGEAIFGFSSNLALAGTLLLIFAPRWKYRQTLVYSIVLTNCFVYAATFVSALAAGPGGLSGAGQLFADMATLDGVVKLFVTNDAVILPAWVHYLAFDMVAGNYLVERNLADPAGLNQMLMGFVVFFTVMAGPIGMLLYAGMKVLSSLLSPEPGVKRS